MSALLLKLKTKSGEHISRDLNKDNTIAALKQEVAKICEIKEELLSIRYGYPPRILDLDNSGITLEAAGIQSGDTLIVEEKPDKDKDEDPPKGESTCADFDEEITLLLRQVVPADNSCLFTSIGFVLNGRIDQNCGSFMRQLIAQHVQAEPETYNEAVLGKPPAEYCQWILNPDSWGGAIEISILSKYYGIEIAVVDSQNGIVNRFGEDQAFIHRVFLIFDGIHYDPLYVESHLTGEAHTLFLADDTQLLVAAKQLAEESQSSKQFTDVQKFSIKCLVCQVNLVGQAAATEHAKSTGHVSFGEV